MQSVSVFDYQNYQHYLRSVLTTQGVDRGLRSRLATHLRCQPSFIYRVLAEKGHLSLEHAIETSRFLRLSADESHYFMLLVEKGKAGSKTLEQYYEEQLKELLVKRASIQQRLQIKNDLSFENQVTYYNSWHVLATHILLSIHGFDSKDKIAQHFRLPVQQVSDALDFLCRSGLASEKNGRYSIKNTRTHLPKGSPLLARHHSNWRIRAIESVDHERADDLHYSGVFSLSRDDLRKIREMMLQLVQKSDLVIRDSKEEVLCCINLDLFEV